MPEQRPLISVCITAYNHERYIRESVLSVLGQHGDFDIEILIGDDGSSDSTRDCIKKLAYDYPEVVKIFLHKENLGASSNLCFLIQRAKGDFIAHLDGDDLWLPRKLELQLVEMLSNPNISAVYCNGKVINDGGSLIGIFNSIRKRVSFNLGYLVQRGNFLLHSTILYRQIHKKHILSIPGNFIDYRIHVRLAKVGNLVQLGDLLAIYRYSSASSMSRKMPRLVAVCYWDTLVEASKSGERLAAIKGAEVFWEKLSLRSFVSLDFLNLMRWRNTYIHNNEIPFSNLRLVWLSVRSIRLIPYAFHKRFVRADKNVLFPR